MRLTSALGASAVMLLIVSVSTLHAEDTKKKWQFGVGFSYWSTDDTIRSNAATAFAPMDPSQAGNLPSILFSDPRPDANELNEATIQDHQKVDFIAQFGLTRWVTLQLDTSYFKSEVGNIEFYTEDKSVPVQLSPIAPNPADPNQPRNPLDPTQSICTPLDGSTPAPGSKDCYNLNFGTENKVIRNAFLPVGQITEIPVALSGVVRFRPESPFDPYVGGGVGYIFTNLNTSIGGMGTPVTMTASDVTGTNRIVTMKGFNDVQAYTNGLVVQSLQYGARGILAYPCHQVSFYPSLCVPSNRPVAPGGGTTMAPLTASVNDGMEYHLMGGVDYYFNDRWSLYIDARYVWADSTVKIRIDNQSQVLASIKDYGCQNGAHFCRSVNMGDKDISNAVILNPTVDDTLDVLLIQGGDIRLGGFSLGVGAKVTF